MNILFVCTGNTCRSPMAEAILRHKLPAANVQSAGIYAGENDSANSHAIHVLEKRSIEINHSSQPITEQLLSWADYVFTMTNDHKQALILRIPEHSDKYYTLKEFVIDPEKALWTRLHQAYDDVEKKREQFLKENEHLSSDELERKLNEHLQHELTEILELQNQLQDVNVSDPFGGSLEVYEATFSELEENIEKLVKNFKNKGGK